MKHIGFQRFSELGGVMKGVKMRFLTTFLVVLIGFVAASSAQTGAKAYKFAEFGPMSQASVKLKMEKFLRELAKDPASQGYIVNYGARKAIAIRRTQITRSIDLLRPEDIRITFVDGLSKERIETQLWIVPPGANLPTP